MFSFLYSELNLSIIKKRFHLFSKNLDSTFLPTKWIHKNKQFLRSTKRINEFMKLQTPKPKIFLRRGFKNDVVTNESASFTGGATTVTSFHKSLEFDV
uniref:Uncharacterized protein n=1 Tax=Medicago truncatula TaxID=3880 RepID=I3SCE6_MEDTR|nr:unknown [Medicago truncatula]